MLFQENLHNSMKTTEEKAREIAKLMEDGKGKDVTLLDISGLNRLFCNCNGK